jgi:hypothetical protein
VFSGEEFMLLRLTNADVAQEDDPVLWDSEANFIVFVDRSTPNARTTIVMGTGPLTFHVSESVDEIEKLLRAKSAEQS